MDLARNESDGPATPAKLAAIDLDGTLLGTDHEISAENRQAVARLMASGVEVVLASGRHYLSMLPYARQLPGVRWIVSAQGGEVSDLERTQVLGRHFLTREQLATVMAVLGRHGVSALSYAVAGVVTDSPGTESVGYYSGFSGNRVRAVTTAELVALPAFKVVVTGSEASIDALVVSADVRALDLQQVRTHKRFFEFMPHGVTKASGLQTLTAHLGLTAAQVAAFGDGDNDVPMLAWAGWSFAMPHGWPSAKASARWVGPPGDPNTAFARAAAALG